MDKSHYAVLYSYVAHEIYPRDANHFQRRNLQNSLSRFTHGEGNLYMNGRRVLHAGNVTTELMKLHTHEELQVVSICTIYLRTTIFPVLIRYTLHVGNILNLS